MMKKREDGRTWRAIIESCLKRVFNKKSLDAKRAKEPDPKKRLKIQHVEGRELVEQYADHCDEFNATIKDIMKTFDKSQLTELLDFISGSEDKISGIELEMKKEEYAEGVNKPRRVTKAEQNQNGADITPAMGGKITVCVQR